MTVEIIFYADLQHVYFLTETLYTCNVECIKRLATITWNFTRFYLGTRHADLFVFYMLDIIVGAVTKLFIYFVPIPY